MLLCIVFISFVIVFNFKALNICRETTSSIFTFQRDEQSRRQTVQMGKTLLVGEQMQKPFKQMLQYFKWILMYFEQIYSVLPYFKHDR